jgi:hypothetical protein
LANEKLAGNFRWFIIIVAGYGFIHAETDECNKLARFRNSHRRSPSIHRGVVIHGDPEREWNASSWKNLKLFGHIFRNSILSALHCFENELRRRNIERKEKAEKKNFHFDSCEQFRLMFRKSAERVVVEGEAGVFLDDKGKKEAKLLNKTVKLRAFVWKLIAVERSIDCLVKRIRFLAWLTSTHSTHNVGDDRICTKLFVWRQPEVGAFTGELAQKFLDDALRTLNHCREALLLRTDTLESADFLNSLYVPRYVIISICVERVKQLKRRRFGSPIFAISWSIEADFSGRTSDSHCDMLRQLRLPRSANASVIIYGEISLTCCVGLKSRNWLITARRLLIEKKRFFPGLSTCFARYHRSVAGPFAVIILCGFDKKQKWKSRVSGNLSLPNWLQQMNFMSAAFEWNVFWRARSTSR